MCVVRWKHYERREMVGQWYADPTLYIIRLEVYREALRANGTFCCCFHSNFRCAKFVLKLEEKDGRIFGSKTEFCELLSQKNDVFV